MTSIPGSGRLPAGSSNCQVSRNLFLMPYLEFPSKITYDLTCMITFLVSDTIPGSGWLPAGSSSCQMSRNLFLMPNLEFSPQKTYNSTCMITFLVSDLYTWIRMAPSSFQQLPGVQKFIFDAKFGIPTPKIPLF